MTDEPQLRLGKYLVERELGRGGFATVYQARDTVLHRAVALKVLHPILLTDPAFVRRFETEARTIAQFEHPHIAMIYELEHYEGRLCIAMQLMSGGSLADRISQRGPLSFADAVRVIGDVADALDYAHAAGFIHRDVKPSNILFNARGGAVLTDFGLVKAAEGSVIARTAMGSMLGTPPYMAPEVWEGQGDSPRTDVYALGCVLYEILTGQLLFRGDTPPAVMLTHFQPRKYPDRWPDGTPVGIATLLEQALARDPAERYASAGALALALSQLNGQAARSGPASGQAEPARPPTVPLIEPARPAERTATPDPVPAERAVTPDSVPAGRTIAAETVPAATSSAQSALGAQGQAELLDEPARHDRPEPAASRTALPVDFNAARLIVIALGVVLDIAGGQLVKWLGLPFSVDTIGAALAGALYGPWIGALTGLLGHATWTLIGLDQYAIWFSPVGGVVGLLAGFAGRLGLFQRRPPRVLAALAGGVLMFALALFLLMFSHSSGGNGDRLVLPVAGELIAQNGPLLLVALGTGLVGGYSLLGGAGYAALVGLLAGAITSLVVAPIWVSLFGGEAASIARSLFLGDQATIEPFDKLLVLVVAYSILQLLPRQVLRRVDGTGASATLLPPAPAEEHAEQAVPAEGRAAVALADERTDQRGAALDPAITPQRRAWQLIVLVSAAWIVGWIFSLGVAFLFEGHQDTGTGLLIGWIVGWAGAGLLAGLGLRWVTRVTRIGPIVGLAAGWSICMSIALVAAVLAYGAQPERGLDTLALGTAVAAGIAGLAMRRYERAVTWGGIVLLALAWAAGWRLAEVIQNDGSGGGPWHGVLYKFANGGNFHATFEAYSQLKPAYLVFGGILGAALGAGVIWLLGRRATSV